MADLPSEIERTEARGQRTDWLGTCRVDGFFLDHGGIGSMVVGPWSIVFFLNHAG